VEEIKKHPFFATVDWNQLQKREIDAPFKPVLTGPRDLKYFDVAFTGKNPEMSMTDRTMNSQNKYLDFTYREQGL
jgi:hypothetical protein